MSPHGDDAWSGTLAKPNASKTDGPFATIEHDSRHHMDWPDSAEVVTLNGTLMVDSDEHMMPHYYLDTDKSGEANYILGFGP